ncbi:MAG: TetR family transcriptional regulator [Propionibacteriaceae bacterium]
MRTEVGPAAETTSTARARDADETRRQLLHAARRRFARHGYTGTTVRQIAGDAGVNVALINRYFTSKEGLFEACLRRVVENLDRPPAADVTVDGIVDSVLSQLAELPSGEHPLELLLLLRSSGDARADEIRRNTLRSFAEGMAMAAGWRPDHPDRDALLLRAQIALSTVLGISLLRSSTGLEPLGSATAEDLRGPLGDTLSALLSR